MANQILFASSGTSAVTKARTNTVNKAGGAAYSLSAESELAQLAMTGCFNDTFYVTAQDQLLRAKQLALKVRPEFLARLAVYSRQVGYMKDLPAFLLAVLSVRDSALFSQVFAQVVDNGKMLRNFIQIVRSGEAGRKSLGSRPKALVAKWLQEASVYQLLAASVGNSPSLADVIRLTHPAAKDKQMQAMFSWLLGAKHEQADLPELVRDLIAFRKGDSVQTPRVPFELLTSCELSRADWVNVARQASWTQTRMNLNTFERHGVFSDSAVVADLAKKLTDAQLIEKAGVFPYQLMAAYLNANSNVPTRLKNALQDAMELAVSNVPSFDCSVAVCVDTSGSMSSPATGNRGSATTVVRCIDVAALFASVVLRKNEDALVVPFDTKVRDVKLNSRDSVMTNAGKLAALQGGGTDCASALKHLNAVGATAELVIYVSDNESWAGSTSRYGRTGMADEFAKYVKRVPKAKLVCIDITPNRTTQAMDGAKVLNVGGFSDEVFRVVNLFAKDQLNGKHWVHAIDQVVLGVQ